MTERLSHGAAAAALLDLPEPPRLDALELKVNQLIVERDNFRTLRNDALHPRSGERTDPALGRLYGARLEELEHELARYSQLLEFARVLLNPTSFSALMENDHESA